MTDVQTIRSRAWPPEAKGCTHPHAEKERPWFGGVPMRKCYSFPGTSYVSIPLGYVCVAIWRCLACDTYWREDEGGRFHEANRSAEITAHEVVSPEYPGPNSLDDLPRFLSELNLL